MNIETKLLHILFKYHLISNNIKYLPMYSNIDFGYLLNNHVVYINHIFKIDESTINTNMYELGICRLCNYYHLDYKDYGKTWVVNK